jgi:hypothetical protein
MESKKIKKMARVNKNLVARFKKSNARPERARVGVVHKPSRLFAENEVLVMESDCFFGVNGEEIYFDISMINMFKYITSVEINKDLPEKLLTLLLEPKPDFELTSWRTVSEDFDNMENEKVKDWNESLKIFGNRYESFLQEFQRIKKETDVAKRMALVQMKQRSAYKRFQIFSTYPAFEMRYRLRDGQVKLTELCLNETFVKEVGYTVENFTNTVLTEGIPQFFAKSQVSRAVGACKAFFEHYMVNDTELPPHEAELFMKTGYRKKVNLQSLELVEIADGDLILSFMLYVKEKSLPYGSYTKEPLAPEFMEILKLHDQEKEYMFNHYYGENFKGLHSNTDKVCKIKELF